MGFRILLNHSIISFLTIITFQNSLFSDQKFNIDQNLETLASLVFLVQEKHDSLNNFHPTSEDPFPFSKHDLSLLWVKGDEYFKTAADKLDESIFNEALEFYHQSEQFENLGLIEHSQSLLALCSQHLINLWEKALSAEDDHRPRVDLIQATIRSKTTYDPNLENNHYLSDQMKDKMRPYLVSFHHPMRHVLDSLFLKKRITVDSQTFKEAGFHVFAIGPRSHVRVARHHNMPRYLVKVVLDTTLSNKGHKSSWEWFVQRCEGAEKIRNVIKSKRIKNFIVPHKWIYCLPAEPSPPKDSMHKRHYAIVLVTDMNLASHRVNLHAWKHYITKTHLKELYYIISRAKGSSYRPDNIAYTKSGKFAFIDTEYPSEGPDFKCIRPYLSSDMKIYWDQLVKDGN